MPGVGSHQADLVREEEPMRASRWLVTATIVGTQLAVAAPAIADGGAYIELDRTYVQVGGTVEAVTYVAIPERQQDVLDRGPFYAYLVPADAFLQERKPPPSGTIRLGAFTVVPSGKQAFELRATLTMPDVPSGSYNLQLCNDPCTVAGFREPLTGFLTIAGTAAEARLIGERDWLQWRVAHLRQRADKLRSENEDLETGLAALQAEADALAARVADLQARPPAAPIAAPEDTDRPIVDAWALVAIAIALLVTFGSVALAIVFSRRHAPRVVVPDTIAELEEEAELRPVGR
jgi:hypothetical protein